VHSFEENNIHETDEFTLLENRHSEEPFSP